VILAVALLAAACSGSSGSAAPRRGGVLREGVVGLKTLDPALADTPVAAGVAELLFEPLVHLDRTTQLAKPGLAARWTVDASQTHFTFVLRRGARFGDGSPVAATDVKATLDRVAAKATNSPLAPLLELVAGYKEVHLDGSAPGLSGVVVRDARTIAFTTTQPWAVLPAALGHPGLGIMPPAVRATVAEHPVGSGPFRLEARDATHTRLVRSTRRRGPAAHLDAVELMPFNSVADASAAFEAGKIDVLRLGREAPAARAGAKPRARRDVSRPYLAVGLYALNLKNFKFVDPRFRQAIIRAVDPAKLEQLGYGDRADVTHGIIPRGVPGGPTDGCTGRCDHDLATAKQLLAQAFPNGGVPGVFVDFDDEPTQAALAAEVVNELVAAGIPAATRPHPAASYDSFLANEVPDLFRLGWVGDFPSGDAFLSPLFVSGAAENVARVVSRNADAEIKAAEAEPAPKRQARHFAAAERVVLDQFALAPFVQFQTRLAVAPNVRELRLDVLGGFDGASVWLARR
jgi:oligopeptide transport system substrate-binding protein